MRLICVSYACHMRVVCVTRILRVVVCVTFLCRPHLLLGLPRGEGRRIGGGSVAFGGGGAHRRRPPTPFRGPTLHCERLHLNVRVRILHKKKKGGKNTCGGMYIWEASGSVAYGEISDLIYGLIRREKHLHTRTAPTAASPCWHRGYGGEVGTQPRGDRRWAPLPAPPPLPPPTERRRSAPRPWWQ